MDKNNQAEGAMQETMNDCGDGCQSCDKVGGCHSQIGMVGSLGMSLLQGLEQPPRDEKTAEAFENILDSLKGLSPSDVISVAVVAIVHDQGDASKGEGEPGFKMMGGMCGNMAFLHGSVMVLAGQVGTAAEQAQAEALARQAAEVAATAIDMMAKEGPGSNGEEPKSVH